MNALGFSDKHFPSFISFGDGAAYVSSAQTILYQKFMLKIIKTSTLLTFSTAISLSFRLSVTFVL